MLVVNLVNLVDLVTLIDFITLVSDGDVVSLHRARVVPHPTCPMTVGGEHAVGRLMIAHPCILAATRRYRA